MTRSKDIGTKAETGICGYLTGELGILFERGALRGRFDRGDIHAHDFPITIEAKAGKVLNLRKYGDQLAIECANKNTDYGVVIWKPPGVGYSRLEQWLALEWAPVALPATRTRRIPHVGPIKHLHTYVAQCDQWGPVYTDYTGRTPTPGADDWIRIQHLHHWVDAVRENIATIRITAVTTP